MPRNPGEIPGKASPLILKKTPTITLPKSATFQDKVFLYLSALSKITSSIWKTIKKEPCRLDEKSTELLLRAIFDSIASRMRPVILCMKTMEIKEATSTLKIFIVRTLEFMRVLIASHYAIENRNFPDQVFTILNELQKKDYSIAESRQAKRDTKRITHWLCAFYGDYVLGNQSDFAELLSCINQSFCKKTQKEFYCAPI